MSEYTKIVGMTGGMGAGKSTMINVALEMGIPIFDYDYHVRKAYEDQEFANFVGRAIYLNEETVTKAMVAEAIVADPTKLPVVERCVMAKIEKEFAEVKATNPAPFLLVDAPMLFEMGWDQECDFVIAIQCPREIREERVMKRPGMTAEKMKLLMDKQMSEEDRLLKGQFIIHTNQPVEKSIRSMGGILDHLREFYA
jgi:dephospho-CoA kinase